MYKISEVAKQTGFSIPTLRYYEELGILKPKRSQKSYREYTEKDIDWIQFIVRLKNTGMPLKDIQTYSRLREVGEQTMEERITLLDKQEKLLMEQKQELESHLQFLQQKKKTYKMLLQKRERP